MRIVIILLFAGAIGFVAKAFMKTEQQPESKAEFQFEKESHDFGKIAPGKAVSVDFKFKNIGNEALVISKVESTSANTEPQYNTSPVKKGETGSVTVKFTAGSQPQGFSKAVMIHSNAKTPVKMLFIKGEIVTSAATGL